MLRIANLVSIKLDIPVCAVLLAYSSFWENIKESIENLQLDLIEKDTKIIKPLSFNIGSIGKLYTHKDRILKINNYKEIHREKNENIES